MTPPACRSVYLHIPFCEVKCGYCDFFSLPRGWGEWDLQAAYVEALLREWEVRRAAVPLAGQLDTVFFGGGTPSLLAPPLLEKLLAALAPRLEGTTEITLEANPKTVSVETLRAIRALGVNRLSVGVQSFADAQLGRLGRIHSGAEARATLEAAVGIFPRVSLDLMFGLPEQTTAEALADVETALAFGTEHLSCYQLTIEPETPFAAAFREGRLRLPDEEVAVEQFTAVRERLAAAGLPAYEVSNFARPAAACRHNLNYWRYGDFLGLGAGATGQFGGRRWRNTRRLAAYRSGSWQEAEEFIPPETAAGEFLLMGLRLAEGIAVAEFARRFGRSLWETYPGLFETWLAAGRLRFEADRLAFTSEGLLLANELLQALFAGQKSPATHCLDKESGVVEVPTHR